MRLSINYAQWDSEFLHFKTGIIKIPSHRCVTIEMLSSIKKDAEHDQYKLLYIMTSSKNSISQDIIDGVKGNITLVDKKTIYSKLVSNKTNFSEPHIQSLRQSTISNELYSLALESGKYSRFKNDPLFPKGTFEHLYKIWLERSVKKEIATDVIIYQIDNSIKGFLTYKINEQSCTIGLIAVSSEHQGQGIGSKLISYLEHLLSAQHIHIITVATQGHNTHACNFYKRNNFQIDEITYIYHLWL